MPLVSPISSTLLWALLLGGAPTIIRAQEQQQQQLQAEFTRFVVPPELVGKRRELAEKATKTPKAPTSTVETKAPTNTKTPKGATAAPSITPSASPAPSMTPSSDATGSSTVVVTPRPISYLETPGTCNAAGYTLCDSSSNEMTSNFVVCYRASDFGVTAPIVVDGIRFWIDAPLSAELYIQAWVDSDVASASLVPNGLAPISQSISGYTLGENEFTFDTPITSTTGLFCVGLLDPDDITMYGVELTTSSPVYSYFDCFETGIYTSFADYGVEACIEPLLLEAAD